MARISGVEKDLRVHQIAEMLVNGKRPSECVQHAAKTWGIAKRQADAYIAEARQVIRADYSADRSTFLAEKLAALAKVQEKAMESNQLGAAVGAVRLAAELAQLV